MNATPAPATTPVPVTVFGKPGCQGCKLTARHLDKQGTPYFYRDVTEDADAFKRVTDLGYAGLPVVEAGDMHWTGYSPDRLNKLGSLHTIAADIAALDAEAEAYLAEDELVTADLGAAMATAAAELVNA